jgi:parallel beta-helix repeat protein
MLYLGNSQCDKMIKEKVSSILIMILFVSSSSYSTVGVVIFNENLMLFGTTLYVGGEGPGNYTTIQDAIDNATFADTVFVYDNSSPYYENIKINQSIFIIGEDKNTTIIDGRNQGTVVQITSNGVFLSGFTIQHGFCGINLFCSNSNLNNNIICNNSFSNIELYFLNCSFEGGYNTIIGNIICNSTTGINLVRSSNNMIHSNQITNNNFGLTLCHSSNRNKIFHNNFINNTQHAYDECNNSWDNKYPSCGNYWDDYSGKDNYWGLHQTLPGMDGVGDTPYDLPCEYATDRYPLIESYGKTELSFQLKGGLFKYSGIIQNNGNKTAFNVHWKITIDGGFILLGRNFSGLLKPLLPYEKATVPSVFMFGFGRVLITCAVWADNAPYISRATPGLLLLFFFQITPGGILYYQS